MITFSLADPKTRKVTQRKFRSNMVRISVKSCVVVMELWSTVVHSDIFSCLVTFSERLCCVYLCLLFCLRPITWHCHFTA